jgi:hypothetical protein
MEKANYGPSVGTPTRQTQIMVEMELIDKMVSSLVDATTELEMRVNPVLRKPFESGANPAVQDEELVPLADQLRMFRKRITQIAEHLREIRERVEL